ncbi:hypothetical protein PLICRDRAFT_35023 [Plicaturopsis crispa FD-325 SS-3]|nr:hypothetical protein PLICRDRAFT_35023 [Plicaturopsis crispa FD-325 SS-3]
MSQQIPASVCWPTGDSNDSNDSKEDATTYFNTNNVISRIRNRFSVLPLGAFFSSSNRHPEYDLEKNDLGQGALAPAPTRHYNQDIARIFAKPSNRRDTLCQNKSHACGSTRSRNFGSVSSVSGSVVSRSTTSAGVISISDMSNTPPLTPDSLNDLALSPALSWEAGSGRRAARRGTTSEQHHDTGGIHIHDQADDHGPVNASDLKREGKKPARPICYDTLIADISTDRPKKSESAVDDDWYGFEYTLELSRRSRRPSDAIPSAGQCSKSRESWAIIHRGAVQPHREEEEYYHWRRWHAWLENMDRRRRTRTVLEFEARAKDAAMDYAEELMTRAWLWENEDEMLPAEIELAREHLSVVCSHRPDPFYPPVVHELAWFLKRSRSVANVRELYPLPSLPQD